MSAISTSQIEEITRIVRQQLASGTPGGSIMRDERTWAMLIRLQSYAVEVLEELHEVSKTPKEWIRGLQDIVHWSNDVLGEEVERLVKQDGTLQKKYEFTVVRYIKHLHRNAKSHRMKLNLISFEDYIREFMKTLIVRPDVQNQQFLSFGPVDQQGVVMDTIRLTLDSLYNKKSTTEKHDFVVVGRDSIVGGGSIAPSESVSCVGNRQLSAAALEQHKKSKSVANGNDGSFFKLPPTAPPPPRATVSRVSAHSKRPDDHAASVVRRNRISATDNNVSSHVSKVTGKKRAASHSHVSSQKFKEVDLTGGGGGGGGTQVSSRSSKFRRPPRHSVDANRAPSQVSRVSRTGNNPQKCFFDLNSKFVNDVQSHAL